MNMDDKKFSDGSERPATEQDKAAPKRLSSVMSVVATAHWLHEADKKRQRDIEKTLPASFVPPNPAPRKDRN